MSESPTKKRKHSNSITDVAEGSTDDGAKLESIVAQIERAHRMAFEECPAALHLALDRRIREVMDLNLRTTPMTKTKPLALPVDMEASDETNVGVVQGKNERRSEDGDGPVSDGGPAEHVSKDDDEAQLTHLGHQSSTVAMQRIVAGTAAPDETLTWTRAWLLEGRRPTEEGIPWPLIDCRLAMQSDGNTDSMTNLQILTRYSIWQATRSMANFEAKTSQLTRLIFTWYNVAGVRSLRSSTALARSANINLGDSMSLAMERLSNKEEPGEMKNFMHRLAVELQRREIACTEEGISVQFLQDALFYMDYVTRLQAIRTRKGKMWEEVKVVWQKGDRAATTLSKYITSRIHKETSLRIKDFNSKWRSIVAQGAAVYTVVHHLGWTPPFLLQKGDLRIIERLGAKFLRQALTAAAKVCADPVDRLRNIGLHLVYDILRRRRVKRINLKRCHDLDDVDQRFALQYDYLNQERLGFPFTSGRLAIADTEGEVEEEDVASGVGIASLSIGEDK